MAVPFFRDTVRSLLWSRPNPDRFTTVGYVDPGRPASPAQLLHLCGINTSGHPRLALMMQYGYRWLAPVDDPATDLLQRSDLSSIERQLLGAADRAPDGSLAKGAGGAPLRALLSQPDSGVDTNAVSDMRSPGPSGENQTDVREPQNAR
jgi:hypothetical protein